MVQQPVSATPSPTTTSTTTATAASTLVAVAGQSIIDVQLTGDCWINIVDAKGNILGKHEGIINFTIGQRKGIKISGEIPYYVIKINPKTKEVIIGKKEELEIQRLKVEDINYLSDKNIDFNILTKNAPLVIKTDKMRF